MKLRVLVDRPSIEVFGTDGRISMSSCFLPPPGDKKISLTAKRWCRAGQFAGGVAIEIGMAEVGENRAAAERCDLSRNAREDSLSRSAQRSQNIKVFASVRSMEHSCGPRPSRCGGTEAANPPSRAENFRRNDTAREVLWVAQLAFCNLGSQEASSKQPPDRITCVASQAPSPLIPECASRKPGLRASRATRDKEPFRTLMAATIVCFCTIADHSVPRHYPVGRCRRRKRRFVEQATSLSNMALPD